MCFSVSSPSPPVECIFMSKPFLFYLFMKKNMYGNNAKLNSIKLNFILFFKVSEWSYRVQSIK